MVETERGCGWRKMGGVYLVCDGVRVPCDALPIELSPCPCCDFTVNQARSMQPINAGYLASLMKGHDCHDDFACPICWFGHGYAELKADVVRLRAELAKPWDKQTPDERAAIPEKKDLLVKLEAKLPKVFYLMFVSKDYYSPESFVKEAITQGISKRVAANSLPAGFKVGTDWIFLAHGETPFQPKAKDAKDGSVVDQIDPYHATGIFFVFKPERLEVLLWKGTDDQLIADYEDAGYTVVLLEKTEENLKRHGNGNPPPLPYGFKRKDKAPLAEDTYRNAKAGVRHRGLYKDPKPEKPATSPNDQGGKTNTTKPETKPKTKPTKTRKRKDLDAEDDEDADCPRSESWREGEL